jgi:hypothetical protein
MKYQYKLKCKHLTDIIPLIKELEGKITALNANVIFAYPEYEIVMAVINCPPTQFKRILEEFEGLTVIF